MKRSRNAKQEIDFTFEIQVVSGEEGKQLRLEQARAIRAFLMWMREQRGNASVTAKGQVETGSERRPGNQAI